MGSIATSRGDNGRNESAAGIRVSNAWLHINHRTRRCAGALVALLGIVWSSAAYAQGLTIAGHVRDEQGAAIVGAEVRVLRTDGSVAVGTPTDGSGAYHFEGLAGGTFVLQVAKPGFRRYVAPIVVEAGAADVDVQLTIAGVDDAVVVTGGVSQSIAEASKAISIIDREEIAARNDGSLGEIVRFTPGVQVRDNGGLGQLATMRIRGVRSDAAAVLVDGMRLRDASTTQGDVSSFLANLNFVAAERVEVLRGSGSSLYGSNAVGGVVNIVTAAGGAPFRGDAQIEGGSLGTFRGRGAVNGGAFDNRLAFSAGGLQWSVADGLDGDDAARSTGGQGMLRYQFSPVTSLTLRLYGSNDRVDTNASPTASGIPAANVPDRIVVDAVAVSPEQVALANEGRPFSFGAATFIPARNDPDSRRRSWFVTSALQFQHVQSDRVSFRATYQRVRTDRTFLNGPLGPGFQTAAESFSRFLGDIDTLDARAILQPASWMDITAGYEFEREVYGDRQDNNLPGPARVATRTDIQQNAHTGYAAANLALAGRRLQMSLAGRVQTFDLQPVELSAVGIDNPYAHANISSPPRALTGDLSVAYLFERSKTKLRTHTGNAYRAPSLFERFGGGFSASPATGDIVFTAYGDPRLRPDRYRTVDAGVDQYFWHDRVLASATYFYIDVASLTAFDSAGRIDPATDPFGRTLGYLNGSGGFSRGVELSVDIRPGMGLRLFASYAHTRAETDEDVSVPGFFIVPGALDHTASLVVSNRWTDRIDTTFDLFYGGESYGSFFAAGRTRAYRYPSFVKAALAARVRLSPGVERPLRAYVKVDNLFDGTYYQGGWRALGRTAVAGVSVGF